MKVGIYGRSVGGEDIASWLKTFAALLDEHAIAWAIWPSYANFFKDQTALDFSIIEDIKDVDVLISLGGDGTVLDTLGIVRDSAVPVMGVNLGRFGFLANTTMDEVESSIKMLVEGSYSIEERAVLKIKSNTDLSGAFPYALNDFVIHKSDSSAMITVDAFWNKDFLNAYWADGLIVATPTGSSGYSLSCGGPLLFPGSKSFVITPIAAHNLTVRPAVLPDDGVLSFEIHSRSELALVSFDSQSFKVPTASKFQVSKAAFSFHMIRLEGQSYMETIRTKLMWGQDKRNP